MLIDVIQPNAEHACLSWLKTASHEPGAVSILYFSFSKAALKPSEKLLLEALVPVLTDRRASIYLLHDGDAVIVWAGTQRSVLEQVIDRLYTYFQLPSEHPFHHYYDVHAHKEPLRQRLLEKLELLSPMPAASSENKAEPAISPSSTTSLTPTAKQLAEFKNAKSQRALRKKPEILIVEDQSFSRKLLQNVLDKTYRTHASPNAMDAFEQHLTCAADILMLDIELPDLSGHQLAEAIRQFDPDVSIIMVTANHYLEDVTRAKAYGAKGFVVKPYNIQKIMDAVQHFKREA